MVMCKSCICYKIISRWPAVTNTRDNNKPYTYGCASKRCTHTYLHLLLHTHIT